MPKKDYKTFSVLKPGMIKRLLKLPKPEVMELFNRINNKLYLVKWNILKDAFEQNILTEKEYEDKYKDMFYDDYGGDSFIQYLNAVMNAKVDFFVTENERMLNRKDELERRFGLKIASPDEIAEKEKNKK